MNAEEDADAHLALVGLRGRLRLLAGMVRDNRPWRLVPHLSSATAAAAATGAHAIVTTSSWSMAASLSPPRLLLISLVAILAMTTAQLHQPASFGAYLELVWLASSVGIVAGALGSSVESEDAVREAKYGRRELARRRGRDASST